MYLEFHCGVFAPKAMTKQGCRRVERLLLEAESAATQATVEGLLAYPFDELEQLSRPTLVFQFHDVLPGTSSAWVHHEAGSQYTRISEGAGGH